MAFELLDFATLFKCHSAKYVHRNFKVCRMIDNNVTEGNAALVIRNIVLTICYRQITYFFVCYIVARNLNF